MKKVISIILILCIILPMIPVFAHAAETGFKDGYVYIVLTPDGFTKKGAWQKYADEKAEGLPFLLGAIDAKPKTDKPATTDIVLPDAGNYYVHAYSRDFSDYVGTRFYEVHFGDKKWTLGNHGKDGWYWQKTDSFFSFGEEGILSLVDVSGNYARFGGLIITNDPEFTPSDDIKYVKSLSEKQYKQGDYVLNPEKLIEGRPDTDIAVKLNSDWLKFDVDPIILNGRTMVPFRAVFEALNCTVSWDNEKRCAIGERNGMKISLPIGSNTVTVNGNGTYLDQPAEIVDGRTLVPLRFVSETLGASVRWLADSYTVLISAIVPEESVLFVKDSFVDAGTWTSTIATQADGAFLGSAFHGKTPDDGRIGATLEDADTSGNRPAIANFTVSGGKYRIWVRSRDFAENQQGHRFLNVGIDGTLQPHKYGTHGGNGYAWATGGTVELTQGSHVLEVHDTSGFYARFDAVFLTKDLNYIPSENYDTLSHIATPISGNLNVDYSYPLYAKEQTNAENQAVIENNHTKVVFYKVPTTKGTVVQTEIYAKDNGEWVKTKTRDEDSGYLVMRADSASSTVIEDSFALNGTYEYEGKSYGGLTENPFKAGLGAWYVPNGFTQNGNSVTLTFPETDEGVLSAVWSLDESKYPAVSVDMTFKKEGYYSIGAWEGKTFAKEEIAYALAPFRVLYQRVPESPNLLAESYLFTPMGTYTLPENNTYYQKPVTKGIVLEPEWIPLRWVYKDNCKFGISMNSFDNLCRGGVFAPVMGSDESKMEQGEQYNLKYRVISTVSDWFDTYKTVATELFNVHDYRENYMFSLNDVIKNTRELMLDDAASGWDPYTKGYFNIEGKNVATNGNPMQLMQEYLLTGNDEFLTRRAIPIIANTLTRKDRHFNRIGERGGAGWSKTSGNPDSMGNPVQNFNANVIGGMYEMTRGAVPYLHSYAIQKGNGEVYNVTSSTAPFANDLSLYKYTGEQKYLDSAISKADKYLEEVVYARDEQEPVWSSFIYISYFPNLSSVIDIYEVTKDKKYLDAATDIARWMSTALWVPGIDGDKINQNVTVNGENLIYHNNYTGVEIPADDGFWWFGPSQFRAGKNNAEETAASNNKLKLSEKQVNAKIPSRVGLGLEQASTFTRSSNIIMQCFAGDFMKLAAYTNDNYFAVIARNAIIGRFKSYDGYYRSAFSTYELESDYAKEGPDYNGIYWHHIPPFMAMLEDFLINQAFYLSNENISFPSLRQQGYAYFNSNQYGHASGKFYDEQNMWLWIDEGIVSPDSIQIDYIAARGDGKLGLSFMNESNEDITASFTLGEKSVPGYTGTATVYGKDGKSGTVEIVNGVFSLTVPKKGICSVVIKDASVKAPSYSSLSYEETKAEIGATVSNHTNGKGYTLQMSPDCYFAYVYITDMPKDVKSLAISYNGKTETTDIYPFEFIIKVDDVNKEFNYSLTATKADGTKEDYGKGKLMTAKLSKEKGLAFTEDNKNENIPGIATEDAKKLKFKEFKFKYRTQGVGASGLRFVVNYNDIPFKPTASNVVGLPVTGKVIDKDLGEEIPFETYIVGFEERDGSECTIVVNIVPEIASYKSTYENPNYTWDAVISPISK